MKPLSRITAVCLLIFATSLVSFSQQTFELKTDINLNLDLLPKTTVPIISVEFVGKNALSIKKLPNLESKNPYFGEVLLGNSLKRQSIKIILDEKPFQKKRFFFDINNNGDLTDDGEPFWDDNIEGVLSKQVLLNVVFNENGKDFERQIPYKLSRLENPVTKQVRVILQPAFLRQGKLNMGDKTYKVLAQTYNKQGLFSDPKDITLAIDRDQDGIIDSSLLSAEIFWGGAGGGGKPFNIGGETYFIAKSSISGDLISFAVSKEKVAPKNYISVGKLAPKFSFKDLNGENVSFETIANKVVLLDFWATWCIPCVQNLPKLKRFTEKFSSESFIIVGISMDGGAENESDIQRIKKFVDKQDLVWHTSFENKGMDSEIGKSYNIVDLPLYIIIDKKGVIQLVERGINEVKLKKIDETIQKLIED